MLPRRYLRQAEIIGDKVLFDQLNSYHSNIKLKIELNPTTFLDTKLTNIMMAINSTLVGKAHNYLYHRTPKLQNTMKEM